MGLDGGMGGGMELEMELDMRPAAPEPPAQPVRAATGANLGAADRLGRGGWRHRESEVTDLPPPAVWPVMGSLMTLLLAAIYIVHTMFRDTANQAEIERLTAGYDQGWADAMNQVSDTVGAAYSTGYRAAQREAITIETGVEIEALEAGERTTLICGNGRRAAPFDLVVRGGTVEPMPPGRQEAALLETRHKSGEPHRTAVGPDAKAHDGRGEGVAHERDI